MKKLVVVDLNFCWPPDGGAPVHLHWILEEYSKMYEVTLYIPRISRISDIIIRPWPLSKTKFFIRGHVDPSFKPSYKIVVKDYKLMDFRPKKFMQIVSRDVDQLNPDHVFISDGWFLKPYLCLALKKWKPVVKLFTQEMLCIKGNGMMFRRGKVCNLDYLDSKANNWATCTSCSSSYLVSYPSPRWILEYLLSGAFKPGFRDICRKAFDSTRMILVGNRFVKSHLAPFTTKPVTIVPNFTDDKKFTKRDLHAQSIFKILLIGRMDMPSKGFHVALEAFKKCWDTRQDFVVQIVTNVAPPDMPFIKNLGWLSYDQIAEVYKSSDVMVVPSLLPDNSPNVILEAMASGVAVIGTNVGGIPEQIDDKVTGFLFEPGNVEELTKLLLWSIGHRDEIGKMGCEGRLKVENNFSRKIVFEKFYKNLFESSL